MAITAPTWKQKAGVRSRKIGKSIINWEWTKVLLHWLIISSGVVSSCFLLLASIWMCVNANVHALTSGILGEAMTITVTQWATTCYIVLPELIVALAFVTTYGHFKMYRYNRNTSSLVWMLLFGLPTFIFLVLSGITLGCSVANTTFIMPTILIVIRALAAFLFAFSDLLYTYIGKEQEADRLLDKDVKIANLIEENAIVVKKLQANKDAEISELTRKIDVLILERDEAKSLLAATLNAKTALANQINKASEDALQGYSEDLLNLLRSNPKTISAGELITLTGHPKRRITNAINSGMLQTASRNKELILVSSLTDWLRNTPAPNEKKERNTEPQLRIVSN